MKKDSKQIRRAAGRRSRGGTLLGVFIGLVIGVLMSFGVVWYMKKAELPFRDKGVRAERPAGTEGDQPEAPLPGKPGERTGTTGDKPRFEFYKILPGSQEAAPAPAPTPAPAPAAAAPAGGKSAEAKAPADAWLQVGAFQQATDADNLKARLALLGLDASVQEVAIPEKGRMYRVRTGPFASIEEMNRARALLSQNGIQTTSVKGK